MFLNFDTLDILRAQFATEVCYAGIVGYQFTFSTWYEAKYHHINTEIVDESH